MRDDVAAGIVLYNPDIERLNQNLCSITKQVCRVFLVDNASKNIKDIQKLLEKYPNCSLQENTQNKGIASALNQLMYRAEQERIQWLLTLDDDSLCDDDLVQKLEAFTNKPRAGIICAKAVNDYSEKKMSDDRLEKFVYNKSEAAEQVESCITAGSLTNIKAWRKIGGFDEAMFIDFVDVEYCTRLKMFGYEIWKVNHARVHQQYGNISGQFCFLGRTFYLFNYSPQRIYYSVRNQIYYMKKHKKALRISRQVFYLFGYIGKRIVFEKDRFKSLCAVIKGVRDGIRM